MSEMLQAQSYFDLRDEPVALAFERVKRVWDLLSVLPEFLDELVGGRRIIKGTVMRGAEITDGPLYIGPGAVIEPGAFISASSYIGDGAVVRHGAYVRECCVFMEGSLLGHASEAKNSLFLRDAKAPHFAYVGDSILGRGVNLGAGTKVSNLRVTAGDGLTVQLDLCGEKIDSGLRKFGAILGDGVEIGCNAVLNPGVLMAPGCVVYPGAVVPKGFYLPNTMVKLRQEHDSALMVRGSERD